MCGIYGIVQLDGAPAPADALRAMGRLTHHRGPDDEGRHVDGPVAFGMRRLSIIDVGGGHQPLTNEDGTLWLVANAMLITRPFYAALFVAQLLCYVLAFIGWMGGGRIRWKPVFVPFYFCLINVAAAAALVRFLRGERTVLWTPRKGA